MTIALEAQQQIQSIVNECREAQAAARRWQEKYNVVMAQNTIIMEALSDLATASNMQDVSLILRQAEKHLKTTIGSCSVCGKYFVPERGNGACSRCIQEVS